MSANQAVAHPEPQAAQVLSSVVETAVAAPAAVTENTAPVATDAARQEVQPPEQRTVAADAAPEASTADSSIAPKEQRPPLPQPETSAPSSLADVSKAVELAAAQNAGELIAQANAAGAAIPVDGLAVTVTIQPVTPVAASHTAQPAIEQPAIAAEAKPEGLALAAEVPAQTIAIPAANEATIVPQQQVAKGVTR